jgi:hypothetical protein
MKIVRNAYFSKPLSILLLFIFLSSVLNPVSLYGLSSGPGQPELEGFAPVGMDDMVDLFTGDFSYNIPLLTVPGPDGGYPLNLAYSAGITMEQEASWVGLGWSLNPGAVNREVRGLPDDFSGQGVQKKYNQKANRTFSVGIATKDIEVLGADLSKVLSNFKVGGNLNLIYNNYKGFSVQAGLGFSQIQNEASGNAQEGKKTDPLSKDGQKNYEPSFDDRRQKGEKKEDKKSGFANLMSAYGDYYKGLGSQAVSRMRNGGGLDFASAKTVEDISYQPSRTSFSFGLNIKTGLEIFGVTKDVQVDVMYSDQILHDKDKSVPAFGYLHSEKNVTTGFNGLMDFTRDNQSILTPDSRFLPFPVLTHDIFHVSGQGVSGTVRPYKGGVSLVSDPKTTSRSAEAGGGLEVNFGFSEIKGGGNFRGGYTESYTGPWSFGAKPISFLASDHGANLKEGAPLFESSYYKFMNELTSVTNESSIHNDPNPSKFKLHKIFRNNAPFPAIFNTIQGGRHSSLNPSNSFRMSREKRSKAFFTLTEREASQYNGSYTRSVDIVGGGSPETVTFNSNSNDPNSNKIGEIHVTNESGQKYIYGIPANNKVFKQSTFSVSPGFEPSNSDPIKKTVPLNASDNSSGNSKGIDNFYSSTETPEHAHSYLLTEMLSEDYVDLGGSNHGPSQDDFGSYTQFKYQKVKNFKSRSPIQGAHYLPGKLADSKDDKASISYFEKDLYYLKSVETKTHIAIFELNSTARTDARGVTGENGGISSTGMQRSLRSITLYNTDDYQANGSSATPIKTVNFDYAETQTLCPGAPNASNGKLTLKSIYYTVGNERTKATLSPYTFDYYQNIDFTYSQKNVDRWGCFQKTSDNTFGSNTLYPYTLQNDTTIDYNARAWNLKQISLPTGGKINISYESDDYRYVQDRKAQQMYEIKGFAASASATNYVNTLEDNNYAVIQLPKTIGSDWEAKKYTAGLSETYFKAFVKLKDYDKAAHDPGKFPFSVNDYAHDFIDGYLRIEGDPVRFNPNGEGLTDKIIIKMGELGGDQVIQKSGWIEMQMNRSELLDDSNISIDNMRALTSGMLGTIISIIEKAIKFSESDEYFIKANTNGWCDAIGNDLPSIIRLNSPTIKEGGGHRVKQITISDEWATMGGAESYTYGQKYFYTNPDGTSSGVAQYEPTTGGEENPFREGVRYSSDRIIFKDNYYFTEKPIGESIFPAPKVGYSRVKVVNIANEQVTTHAAGTQVHEFYTAKDYPIDVNHTSIGKVNLSDVDKVLKFLGVKNYFQPGFTQGYSITLNDMHGKPKSSATYSAFADVDSNGATPKQKTEYFYQTQNGYNPQKKNKLDSEAYVYYGEGLSKKKKVGVTQDTYVDFKESATKSIFGGGNANLSVLFLLFFPVPLPSGFPNIEHSHNSTRSIVLAKTINTTGILEKVVHTVDNAQTVTEHLAFDNETGEPIMTSVSNPYDGKVYTYNQRAKWHYGNLNGIYNNIGAYVSSSSNYDHLKVGDVLLSSSGDKAWVTGVNPVAAKDASNNTVNLNDYRVIKSGNQNMISQNYGSMQSLVDYRDSTFIHPIFDHLKLNLTGVSYDSTDNRVSNYTSAQTRYIYNYSAPNESQYYKLKKPQTAKVNFTDCKYTNHIDVQYAYERNTVWSNNTTFRQGTDIPNATYPYTPISDVTDYINNLTAVADKHTITISIDAFSPCLEEQADGQIVINFTTPFGYRFEDFDYYHSGGSNFFAIDTSGIVFSGTSNTQQFGECFDQCLLLRVLNASAGNYSDGQKYNGDLPSSITTSAINSNKARYAFSGVFKPYETYFYPSERSFSQPGSAYRFDTDISKDGEIEEFQKFNPLDTNRDWRLGNTVSLYDYNGAPIEEKNAVGIYSSALFGYHRTLPTGIASNAKYSEIAFESFEDHGASYQTGKPDGHINFSSNVELNSTYHHTGAFSIKTTDTLANADLNDYLALESGQKYVLHAWKKSGQGSIRISTNTTNYDDETISPSIEGWEMIELTFIAGSTNSLKLRGTGSYFDDIRIQPFEGRMKCYVYNPLTNKLIAELDENHFATLYNYDRDQVLVQVKKETERGVKTIQSTQRVTAQ